MKKRVAAVRGSPMLPVPRPAHLKKKQEKDGWTEVEEFVEVDVNGNELFAKTTKQANLEQYFCKICKQGRKMLQNKVLCTSLGKPFYNSEVYLTV